MPTRPELLAEAKSRGLKGYSTLKKADLQKMLDTPPPKPPRGVPRGTKAKAKATKAKPAPKAKAKASQDTIENTLKNFPFKTNTYGRAIGLEKDDLLEMKGDKAPYYFVFNTPAKLLKDIESEAKTYRPGGGSHGALSRNIEEMYDLQEKYIRDGKYKPPSGVIAKHTSKGKAVAIEYLKTPMTVANFKKTYA